MTLVILIFSVLIICVLFRAFKVESQRKQKEIMSFGNKLVPEPARDSLIPVPIKQSNGREILEIHMESTRLKESIRQSSAPPPIFLENPKNLADVPPPPDFIWEIAKIPLPSKVPPPPDFILNRNLHVKPGQKKISK